MTNYRQLKTKDLEKMEVTQSQPLHCSAGSRGPIYKILSGVNSSSEKVAKFSWSNDRVITKISTRPNRVQHEHDICKFLYENRVNVPEPEGVFKFQAIEDDWRNFPFSPKHFPAFVMNYLNGYSPTSRSLLPEEKTELEVRYNRELSKVWKLGITPQDTGLSNSIWVPEEERLYLIDFERWTFPGELIEDYW